MQRKVGILTITHSLMNYGNRLQNYALQKVLVKMGYDVKTVHYTPSYEHIHRPASTVSKRNILVRIFRRMLRESKRLALFAIRAYRVVKFCGKPSTPENKVSRFNEFIRTKIRWTEEEYTFGSNFSELDREFDCLIAGSDQIWNPYWEGTQPVYFMEYVPAEKRTAYAASFGVSSIPDDMKEQFSHYLKQIPRISCREDRGCEIVEELTGTRPEHVIDPVFLLSREEWAEIEERPSGVRISEAYVLVYFLGRISEQAKQHIKVHRRSGMSVIYLDRVSKLNTCFASPQEFLYLVNHAGMILTDSFHGCAFSIIFNKPFIYCERSLDLGKEQDMSSRFSSLFNMLGCSKNMTDYTDINKAIHVEQQKALEFLRIALPH